MTDGSNTFLGRDYSLGSWRRLRHRGEYSLPAGSNTCLGMYYWGSIRCLGMHYWGVLCSGSNPFLLHRPLLLPFVCYCHQNYYLHQSAAVSSVPAASLLLQRCCCCNAAAAATLLLLQRCCCSFDCCSGMNECCRSCCC